MKLTNKVKAAWFIAVAVIGIITWSGILMTIHYKAAKQESDLLLTLLDSKKYDEASSCLTSELRQADSSHGLSGLIGSVQKDHGTLVSHSGPVAWEFKGFGADTIKLVYIMKCEHSSLEASVSLRYEDNQLKVQGLYFSQ